MGVLLRLIVLTVGLCSVVADRASGFEWLRRHRTPAENAMHFMGSPPGAQIYPEKVGRESPPYGPLRGVPTYDWGFFGGRSGQVQSHQRGYYGDDRYFVVPRSF